MFWDQIVWLKRAGLWPSQEQLLFLWNRAGFFSLWPSPLETGFGLALGPSSLPKTSWYWLASYLNWTLCGGCKPFKLLDNCFFFFFFNKFGVQILDSGPGFPTDSLYGQLLFTLEEKPLGNGITIILSILRVPPYTDLNLSPSSCTFLRKWTNLTKGNLEYLWPLWRTFEVLKFN